MNDKERAQEELYIFGLQKEYEEYAKMIADATKAEEKVTAAKEARKSAADNRKEAVEAA